MIYLEYGSTQSIWLSLRESIPVGATESFEFKITNDISGEVVSFNPIDQQPTNTWSRFDFTLGTTASLPDVIVLEPGMHDYEVKIGTTVLETGKILVDEEEITWTNLERPAKNVKVLRR